MKRSLKVRLVFAGILPCMLLACAGAALAQQSTSRITGQIFGANRRPLADVYVELRNEVETVLQRTKTNGSGVYTFANLTAGRFSVRVRPFGTAYEEQIQDVELTTIVGGRNVADIQYKDFYLKTRRDVASTTPVSNEVVYAQEVSETAKRLYDKAIVDLAAGRTDNGIVGLEEAVKDFPTYFAALDRLGVEMLKRQRYTEAVNYFERSTAVNVKSSNSWYGLAFARYATENVKGSIEAGIKAAELAPESSDINLMLGIALRRGRNYVDAERSMLKAKKLSRNLSADVSWNLALLYVYNIKNSRLAADELENYLKVKPDHPEAQRIKRLISQLRMG